MEKSELFKMRDLEKTHWWYSARRQLLLTLLPEKTKNILEIGCGTGHNLIRFKEKGIEVEGIEIDKDATKIARAKGLLIYNSPIENFEFKKNYDLILIADVLEHLKNDELVLKKLKTAINKKLIITVPAFQFLFSQHDELNHHYRRYNKKQLELVLKKAGFEIEFISYWNFFLFVPIAIIKLIKKSFGKNAESDMNNTPKAINWVLKNILKLENFIIKQKIPLPFGISLVCIAKPKK